MSNTNGPIPKESDTRWINIMTNFMIKILKVDKKFEKTIRDFITDHEDEFRKKYKNTLALNNESKFAELKNCKIEADLKTKLSEITGLKLVKKQEKKADLLITDVKNPEVIKFKKMRTEVRETVKNTICKVLSIALTGNENEKVDVSDLYPTGSVIPLKKFLPPENTSLSIELLTDALKIELGGKKYNPVRPKYLWREVFTLLSDILAAAENNKQRKEMVKKELLSLKLDIGDKTWKPLTEKDLVFLTN